MKVEKRNHKGFTLVELLIAVVILAVVVIPLANNFVLSAKINQKSKKVLNGTTMIQNVMEGMNAYTIEEIIMNFENHNAVSSNTLAFLPKGISVSNYGELDVSGNSIKFDKTKPISESQYGEFDISGNVVDIKSPADNKYMLFAQNVKQGKNLFDLRFTIDASTYVAPTTGTPVAGKTYYNSDTMTNIASLNPVYDCSYTEEGSEFRDICAEFAKKSTTSTPTLTFRAHLKRTMKILIKDVGTPVAPDISVDVINDYTCEDPATYGIASADNSQQKAHLGLFSSSVNGKDPRNIYIYYRGNYESKWNKVLDNIEVTNTSGKPVTVYLVRVNIQDDIFAIPTKSLDPGDPGPITEADYGVNVRLIDTNLKTTICSNLRNDISQDKISAETVTRANFYLGNSLNKMTPDEYKKSVNVLSNQTEKDIIHTVKIEIFEPGAAIKGFKSEDLITTINAGAQQ